MATSNPRLQNYPFQIPMKRLLLAIPLLLTCAFAQEICIEFEGLEPGTLFGDLGNRPAFEEGGVEVFVGNVDGGFSEVVTGGKAKHAGNELVQTEGGYVEFRSLAADGLQFHYAESFSGIVAVSVDGQRIRVTEGMPALHGSSVGGVLISVAHEPFEDGSRGTVTLAGSIDNIEISGEIHIDHICIGNGGAGGGMGPLIIVNAESVSEFQRQVKMEIEASDSAELKLYESVDLGATSPWTVVDEATFELKAGTVDVWRITTVVDMAEPEHFYRVVADDPSSP